VSVNDPSPAVDTAARPNVGATCAPAIDWPVTVSVSRPATDQVGDGTGVTGVLGG
jgi:hypothetical protein